MLIILPSSLHELALFAGAGGGILGGKILGWHTVCAVEWDAYARDVLVARQNDGCLETFPIWDDVQTFDGTPWRGSVDVVSGGFPCQDISVAGKGAGIEGEKSGMWAHMARIIGEVLPRFVLVENSPMLVGRGLARVLGDLAEMGYDAEWGIVGAHHAAAPHKRERIWIVADSIGTRTGGVCGATGADRGRNSRRDESPLRQAYGEDGANRTDPASQAARELPDSDGLNGDDGGYGAGTLCREQGREPSELRGRESDVPDTAGGRLAMRGRTPGQGRHSLWDDLQTEGRERGCWWATEPDVGRVAHGVAARVDRLRCLGNGQVPRVVPLAWDLLKPKK
jgi:DNA (cytosine-5)-methyltransferase 1